ncbi:hypothetical protein EJB05_56271, partial [Eragrostis curvula]
MLGQEDVLVEVSRAFGSKIHVDRDKNPDCHYKLLHVALEILTGDPVSRFHVMSFPWLSDRATEILALAQSRQEPEPLIIRPSSQWYTYYEVLEVSVKRRPVLMEPMRDEFGVWHVCLSMHSSREEWSRHWGSFGPDGDDYASAELIDDVEIEVTEQATEIGPSKEGMADNSVEVTEITEVSGKVRNSANESDGELKAIDLTEDDIQVFSKAAEFRMDDTNVKFVKANGEADQAQEQHLNAHNCMRVSEQGKNRTEAVKKISAVHTIVPSQGNMEAAEDGASPSKVYKNADNASERMGDSSTVIGASKALSASLIRLYRSMNLPVPWPLPSLVELVGASKRRRVSETIQL